MSFSEPPFKRIECSPTDFKIKAIADTLRVNLAELFRDSARDARLATAASCDAPHGRSSNLARVLRTLDSLWPIDSLLL